MTRRVTINASGDPGSVVAVGCLFAFLGMAAAWATHVVWVIGKLAGAAGITGGQLILAVLGSFIPPVGVIHGVMIWFGHGMG